MIPISDEQKSFVEAIRDFVAREAGTREQRDTLTNGKRIQHNQGLYQKLAELGWLGVAIPEEYGGSGGGPVDLCLFLEETSYGMLPISGFAVSMMVAAATERFGTPEQKQEVLTRVAQGSVQAIAMSEPGAGSDVGAMRCNARRDNGSYIVNGQKTWISDVHAAEHVLLVCRTDDSAGKHDGLTMLRIPTGIEGIEIRPINTMAGDVCFDVFFADCRVPAEGLLGTEGAAWSQLMTGLNVERLIIGAQMLGVARRAFDDVLKYVKERYAFGRPIGSFQALKHRIADLATEIECCRLLTYDVAARVEADSSAIFTREASMVKLKVTETAKRVALEGMQMMGGYGYATEYDMEYHVRSTLPATIVGGSSEIQRTVIGKTFGL